MLSQVAHPGNPFIVLFYIFTIFLSSGMISYESKGHVPLKALIFIRTQILIIIFGAGIDRGIDIMKLKRSILKAT